MGLDLVEAIIEIEDEFGISFPEDQQKIITVGELCDYVAGQVKAVPGSDPLRGVALVTLREFFRAGCGVSPDTLQESTLLRDIIPDRRMRLLKLRQMRSEVSPYLSPVELPKWLNRATAAVVFVACGCAGVVLFQTWVGPGGAQWPQDIGKVLALMAGGLLTGRAGQLSLNALVRKSHWVVETYQSVGDLLPAVAANSRIVAADRPVWTTEMVDTRVCAIISRVADLPLEVVTREKKIVDDLGLG